MISVHDSIVYISAELYKRFKGGKYYAKIYASHRSTQFYGLTVLTHSKGAGKAIKSYAQIRGKRR